jgi:GR25 family glycosyltransferase involved in LPS biosynthesis
MDNIAFYCINFNDEERKNRMIKRFENQGFHLSFVDPVYKDDERLVEVECNDFKRRVMSIMLQHMDSIEDFYENTEKEYCVICEDDILISKNLLNDLHSVLENYHELQLDVLLLGYLLPFKLDNSHPEYPLLKETETYNYYNFPYHLWGSQMYLIHRKHAKFLIDKYTMEYALADMNRPYNPDWTLTKDGKKGMIYPMLALEEGTQKSDHVGQDQFHRNCFETHYNEEKFS